MESPPAAPVHDGLTGRWTTAEPPVACPPALRVALVCPYSLSRPGGVQGQVLGLARALGRRGHRVTVFAPLDGPRRRARRGRRGGHRPVGVAAGQRIGGPGQPLGPGRGAGPCGTLRSGGYDVVHVHEPFTPGLPYGLLMAARCRRWWPPSTAAAGAPSTRVLGPVARRLAGRFAVRCAVSEAARSTASPRTGWRVRGGFNGVEVERLPGRRPWPTDRPTVLFLGRHEERKGLAVLLEAFDRLRATARPRP